jgi:hypothetical protein
VVKESKENEGVVMVRKMKEEKVHKIVRAYRVYKLRNFIRRRSAARKVRKY